VHSAIRPILFITLATIYTVDKLCKLVNILSVSLFLVSIVVFFFTVVGYLMVNKAVYITWCSNDKLEVN